MTSDPDDRNQPPAELARRLRDEVRAEAQREADAIISKARSDIKEVVSAAYTELLVLRAQVQAISDQKVDRTLLPASMQQFEAEAENLRRQLGHHGVEEATAIRAPLPEPEPARDLDGWPDREPEPDAGRAGVFATSYEDPVARRPSRRIVPTAAALALIAIAALWFFVRSEGQSDPFGGGNPAPATTETAAAPPATGAPVTSPGTQLASPAGDSAGPPAAAPEAPGRAFPEGTVTLELSATRAVWVRAEVDGNRDDGRIYNPGETWTLGPATSVALRVGDGGALSVSLNGADAAPAGPDGVVVNRRYGEAPASGPSPVEETPPAPAGSTTVAAAPPSPPPAVPSVATAPVPPPPADPAARLDAEIRALDGRWFEATYRGDEATLRSLRAPAFEANDSRGPLTRPPQGAMVERRLGRAGVTMVGADAVLAGRMIEQVDGGMPVESLFSEIWVRAGDSWRLSELRIQPAPPAEP